MNEDLFGSIKQTITETAGAVGKKTEEFVENTEDAKQSADTAKRKFGKICGMSVKLCISAM